MKEKLDTPWFGLLLGIIGIILGLLITLITQTGMADGAMDAFVTSLKTVPQYRADALMFSIIPNPVIFFILNRLLKMNRAANGVVIVSLVLAIYIIALNVI